MIYITQLTGRQEMFNARILTMIVAGFLLVILQSSIVQAQWATSGTNINNTNTGNVGIGTTAPGAKLDVKDTNNFQVTPNQSAAGEFPTSVLINSKGCRSDVASRWEWRGRSQAVPWL